VSAPVDILAFGAHPDDIEIGCGGSLVLATDAGLTVAVADMSMGEMATRGTAEQRQRERDRAAELLGLRMRMTMSMPDTRIGSEPAHRDAVIGLIREFRPKIVLAPFFEDRHPDHAAAGRLVRESMFFAGVAKVGAGAPHRPQRLYHYTLHHPFEPSFVVDVSSVWERRMAAVRAYESQFGAADEARTEIGNSEFLNLLEARARFYGAMTGVRFGEPFYCRGPVAARALPGQGDDGGGAWRYRMFL